MATYCVNCGTTLEGGVVIHRSRVFCTLACALDHYDAVTIHQREVKGPLAGALHGRGEGSETWRPAHIVAGR